MADLMDDLHNLVYKDNNLVLEAISCLSKLPDPAN
jgi:hypothetical protein